MIKQDQIIEIEDIIRRNFVRIISKITLSSNQFIDWLRKNEDNKDTNEYKAILLIAAWYYFELNEFYNEDSNGYEPNPYSKQTKKIDYFFEEAINIINTLTEEDIEKLVFSQDIKDKLKMLVSKKNNKNFLISKDVNGFYNFKELIIRKYILFYIEKKNKKFNEKIIKAIKYSSITKYTDKMFFIDQIYSEYNLIVYDDYFVEDPKDKYDMYNGLCNKVCCIQYKHNLDLFFFKLTYWIILNNIVELQYLKEYIVEYLQKNKSNYVEYDERLSAIEYLENFKKIDAENIQEVLKNRNIQNISKKQANLVEKIEKNYKLNMKALREENEDWYEFIVQGQFHFELINESEYFDDYCGAVLYWCKCVESMMYEKIFKKLEKANSRYPFYFKVKDTKDYSLGTIPYICGFYKDKRSINDKDISRSISDYIKWPQKIGKEYNFDKFLEDVDYLNIDFRIISAHRESINYDNAEKCRQLIFITSQMINKLIEL